MNINIEKFIAAVEKYTGKNRQACGEGFKLWCPADSHHSASLTINENGAGEPLLHCHAGCSNDDVLKSVGWVWQDFSSAPNQSLKKSPWLKNKKEQTLAEFCSERKLALHNLEQIWGVTFVIYKNRPALRYPTALGVDRLKFLDGNIPKYIWAEKGKGQAHWYGLRQAQEIGGSVLLIVNGEPSVWACHEEGLPAVCPCGESTKPNNLMIVNLKQSGFSEYKIIFDRDKAGRKGAKNAVNVLKESHLQVTALELPEYLGEKADVDDFHRNVGSELPSYIYDLPPLPGPEAVGPKLVPVSEIKVKEVEWLRYPYIPKAMLVTFQGDPGIGKTYAALELCSSLTKEANYVVYGTHEDSWEYTLKPRAEKMGCDCSKIISLQGKHDGDGNVLPMTMEDAKFIEEAIKTYKPVLLVLDPVSAWLGGGTDMNKANKVRVLLAPLVALAEQYKVTILMLQHLSKATAEKAIHKGQGSMDLMAAPRSVLLFGETKLNQKAMVHIKSTNAKLGKSMTFTINEDGFTWTGESNITASDLLEGGRDNGETSALSDALMWLKDELSHSQQEAGILSSRWEQTTGYSRKTLRRAFQLLGGKSSKAGFGPGSKWIWRLPEHAIDKTTGEDCNNLVPFADKSTCQASIDIGSTKEDALSPSHTLSAPEIDVDMPDTKEDKSRKTCLQREDYD
jgi:hypothetical protein